MRGDSCRDCRFAPENESTYNAQRTGGVKPTRSLQFASRNFRRYLKLVIFIASCCKDGPWAAFQAVDLLCGSATRLIRRYQPILRPIHTCFFGFLLIAIVHTV
jgi:hypothetical protein